MIEALTLTDGGQTAGSVAERVAAFLARARRSLDLALYDLALSPETAEPVLSTLRQAIKGGVAVRLAYNVDHAMPIPVPPPPQTEESFLRACSVPTRGIPGVPDLMHQKYVILDGEEVWTGSMNWTDDSWTREENVVVTVRSAVVAAAYARDFDELWSKSAVEGTGSFDPPIDAIGELRVQPWFSPGRGRRITHRIADAIGHARQRVRVASPVITAGPILARLTETAGAGVVDVAGVYDATQMREVIGQWRTNGRSGWKIPLFHSLIERAPFGGKRSTPYGPGTVHDYMHAKVVVADQVVFVGSYNLSHSGQENAENVLEVRDGALADRLAAFVDVVRTRYPAPPLS